LFPIQFSTVAVFCFVKRDTVLIFFVAETVHQQIWYVEFWYFTLGDLLVRSRSISENCEIIYTHFCH